MEFSIKQVSLIYKNKKQALDNINLTLQPGVIGFLGPNGAGKSSLMKILATLARPTKGEIHWQGCDVLAKPKRLREKLGYLPQKFGAYDHLTPKQFLTYMATIKMVAKREIPARVAMLLAQLNLSPEVIERPISQCSGGMRQRVGIAQALINMPQILILDEPSIGLDPNERTQFRRLLTEGEGDRITLLSTHIVSDVESIADKIAIINKGKIVAFDSPQEILTSLPPLVWQVEVSEQELSTLQVSYRIAHSERIVSGFRLRIVSDQQPCSSAVNVKPNLEEAYLAYTQDSVKFAANRNVTS